MDGQVEEGAGFPSEWDSTESPHGQFSDSIGGGDMLLEGPPSRIEELHQAIGEDEMAPLEFLEQLGCTARMAGQRLFEQGVQPAIQAFPRGGLVMDIGSGDDRAAWRREPIEVPPGREGLDMEFLLEETPAQGVGFDDADQNEVPGGLAGSGVQEAHATTPYHDSANG